jgi:hypothetical protein
MMCMMKPWSRDDRAGVEFGDDERRREGEWGHWRPPSLGNKLAIPDVGEQTV